MGRKKKHHYCVDCGTEITRQAIRCGSCAAKARRKRGDYDNDECRRKLSEIQKQRWARGDFASEEYHFKLSEARKKAWKRGIYGEEFRRKLSREGKKRWENADRHSVAEAVKAAWEQGIYDGEGTRRKRSEAMRRRWKRGDFDDNATEEWRRKHSEAIRAARERGAYDGVFQSPTSIELQVAATLDIMGIEHQPQYRPDGYSRIYDEFVPPNTLIEIHGDYWHGGDFPEQQQRDIEKAQWATENGFEFLVIWQHEIEDCGAWAIIAGTPFVQDR